MGRIAISNSGAWSGFTSADWMSLMIAIWRVRKATFWPFLAFVISETAFPTPAAMSVPVVAMVPAHCETVFICWDAIWDAPPVQLSLNRARVCCSTSV